MKASPKHDFSSTAAGWGVACALWAAIAAGRADALLTGVSYVDGPATYALFAGKADADAGMYTSALQPGMALSAQTRVDVEAGGKVMLSPVPSVRLLLEPGTRFLNDSFGYHETVSGGQAFDERVRISSGTLVGDVQGPLHDIFIRIDTPGASISSPEGHFQVAVTVTR